jgi:hypothetical protein
MSPFHLLHRGTGSKSPSYRRGQADIGAKAICLGVLFIPLNTYWIAQLEVVRYTHPTLVVPFFNVIFILLIISLLNMASGKLFGRRFLSRGELVTVYVMLSISSAIASIDMLQILISNMGHAFYFATPENEWRELIWGYLPRWLVVRDDTALEGYYRGGTSLYLGHNIKPWLLPISIWLCFIVVLLFMMLCLCGILRRQWTERERLTYPVIRLPLEMTEERPFFFRNRLMWMGFFLSAFISLVNGLRFFFPVIPEIPVKRRTISYLFTEKPWNLMGSVRVSFYPFVIGVSFLIPLDLLLSCWTFYWFYKAELMFGGLIGIRSLPRFPYQNEQAFGAVISILLFTFWMGREHLKNVASRVWSPRLEGNSDEPLPYRLTVLGFMMGFLLLLLFSSKIGMSLYVIPIFFAIYFLLSTFITRMRAELGLCVHNLSGLEPRKMMIRWFGTRGLGKETLAVFALYSFFNRAYRSHPMPHQLEGYKMAGSVGLNLRKLSIAMLISVAFTVMVVFWEYLYLYYKFGASSGYFGPWTLGFGRETFSALQNWICYPTGTDRIGISFVGAGFLISTALMLLRTRFLWFPLHPLGYAMAGDWGMYNLWSCFFSSFILKWVILKYGGLKQYRRAVPFFLGLALGDLSLGSVWSIMGIAMNTTIYQPFP